MSDLQISPSAFESVLVYFAMLRKISRSDVEGVSDGSVFDKVSRLQRKELLVSNLTKSGLNVAAL
jgi:hypothetical protein